MLRIRFILIRIRFLETRIQIEIFFAFDRIDVLQVGLVGERVLKVLAEYPEVFNITSTMVLFHVDLVTPQQRTKVLMHAPEVLSNYKSN